jgi:ATP-dependent Clp protease ATP-binding subunit ClpC
MFERFTAPARQTVVFAQDEARLLGHGHMGSEHLLLGLLRAEEGVAAGVLKDLGITLERVRDAVRIGGSSAELTSGQSRFTPRAKKVLELALREVLAFRDRYTTTAHILLALTRVDESRATRILFDLGADAEQIGGEVLHALHPGRQLGRGRVGGTHSAGLDASRMAPRTASCHRRKGGGGGGYVCSGPQRPGREPPDRLGRSPTRLGGGVA